MCDFCSEIFDNEPIWDRKDEEKRNKALDHRREWINKHYYQFEGNYLYRYKSSAVNIWADSGDSFCPAIVENILFCPYCGRNLCEKS